MSSLPCGWMQWCRKIGMHAQVAAPALAPFPALSAPSVAPSGAALVPGGAPGSAGAPVFPTLGGPSLAPASGQVGHLGITYTWHWPAAAVGPLNFREACQRKVQVQSGLFWSARLFPFVPVLSSGSAL